MRHKAPSQPVKKPLAAAVVDTNIPVPIPSGFPRMVT